MVKAVAAWPDKSRGFVTICRKNGDSLARLAQKLKANWKPSLTCYRDFPISQGWICIFLINGILHSCEQKLR